MKGMRDWGRVTENTSLVELYEVSEELPLRDSQYFPWEKKILSLRFSASKVTLSGLAGGEYLPLSASKGLAFPSVRLSSRRSLLTLDGCPTSPTHYTHGQRFSPVTLDAHERKNHNLRSELVFQIFQRSLLGDGSSKYGVYP